MINYNSAAELRAFLDKEGLGMLKKYGQNFLINPQVRQSLVEALFAGGGADGGDETWEIGPGLGAMTEMLLDRGLKVKAFEIDTGFSRILKQLFSAWENFSLVEGDVMKTWNDSFRANSAPPYLFGNLPYNIAAVLMADLIENGCFFKRMVVTVQKEVALRMAASAGSADYSSFSVLCSSFYKVKPLMIIRPSSFYPKPNVDSMGVLLEKKDSPVYPAVFFPLVRSLFAARRKTIKNNLSGFLSSKACGTAKADGVAKAHGASRSGGKTPADEICAQVLAENALTGKERAEQLSPEVFLSLAKSVERCDHQR